MKKRKTMKEKFQQFLVDNGAFEKFLERLVADGDFADFDDCLTSNQKYGCNDWLSLGIFWYREWAYWNDLDDMWRKKYCVHKWWFDLFHKK